jgi:hypothetical protein
MKKVVGQSVFTAILIKKNLKFWQNWLYLMKLTIFDKMYYIFNEIDYYLIKFDYI